MLATSTLSTCAQGGCVKFHQHSALRRRRSVRGGGGSSWAEGLGPCLDDRFAVLARKPAIVGVGQVEVLEALSRVRSIAPGHLCRLLGEWTDSTTRKRRGRHLGPRINLVKHAVLELLTRKASGLVL